MSGFACKKAFPVPETESWIHSRFKINAHTQLLSYCIWHMHSRSQCAMDDVKSLFFNHVQTGAFGLFTPFVEICVNGVLIWRMLFSMKFSQKQNNTKISTAPIMKYENWTDADLHVGWLNLSKYRILEIINNWMHIHISFWKRRRVKYLQYGISKKINW